MKSPNKDEELSEKEQLLKADERELVQEINDLGLRVESVYDLVNNSSHEVLKNKFTGPYPEAYTILVKHLDKEHHPRIKEGIIRALTEKDAKKIAGPKILELFYQETDNNMRWVMANALTRIYSWKERQKYPEIKKVMEGI